jgi:predicted anti-sigma-YlaC factor YlaD
MRYFFVAFLCAGCSIKHLALESLADGLSGTGSSFASDDDPELVRDATPFALKTMESLIAQLPDHAPIHVSACAGFTQYAYAFVLTPAQIAEAVSVQRRGAQRAKKLFVRAHDYCLQALDIRHHGFAATLPDLRNGHLDSLAKLDPVDVPALYWAAASGALAITSQKESVDRVADLPLVDALIHRAVALDADWDKGTLQEFLISWDGGRSAAMGGNAERARQAFAKAVALSGGTRAGPYVALAENVSVAAQDKKEFTALLQKALAVDIDKVPNERLGNVIAQERARYLLAHASDLILE